MEAPQEKVIVKIALVGNAEAGKSSLMFKYIEGYYNQQYIQTLGVNFMEKTVQIGENQVLLSIWDLGGEREFSHMLPLVCDGAHVVLYMFDVTSRSSLSAVRDWYKQVRKLNADAIPVLVGAKYDMFDELPEEKREDIVEHARKYSHAMKDCPLVFTSALRGININRLFKLILSLVFGLECGVEQVTDPSRALFEYKEG